MDENAGYGFDKMIKGWKEHYNNQPIVSGDIDNYKIEFYYQDSTQQATQQDARTIKILEFCKNPKSREEYW